MLITDAKIKRDCKMKTCLITLDCEQGSISQRGSRWWSETEKRKTLPPRIDGARESATVSHLAEKFRSHNKESFNPYDAQQNIDRSVIDFFPSSTLILLLPSSRCPIFLRFSARVRRLHVNLTDEKRSLCKP